MTPDQTAEVIRLFRANWTYFEPTADVLALWAQEVADIDGEVGLAAAKRIVKNDERLPSIARFLAECQNVSRARALTAERSKPRPEPRQMADHSAGIAGARAALAGAKPWTPPREEVG